MGAGRKKAMSHTSLGLGLTMGVCISILMSLLMTGIFATMLLNETLQEDTLGIACAFAIVLSAALGAFISAKMVKRRWMIVCLINGVAYYALLLSANALFFEGQYRGAAVTLLLCFAGSAAVGLLGLKGQSSGKRRKKKRRFG